MSWFFEKRIIPSEKNSSIVATRKFGSWQVAVDGVEQTGGEMNGMWKHAFEQVGNFQGTQKIHKILMLGLGAGGVVQTLSRLFPGSTLTVIEFDPAMIALARELKLYGSALFPRVICKDAKDAVPELQGEFDLIIVDLFRGSEPSPLANDPAFLNALHTRLSDSGFLVVNVFRKADLISSFELEFLLLRKWSFRPNHFAVFQKKNTRDAVSNGYIPVRQWHELSSIDLIPSFADPARVGEGVYWRLWPFSFEDYRTDLEPAIQELPRNMRMPIRIVMWQRRVNGRIPPGWICFSDKPFLKVGFTPLQGFQYAKKWSETAQRELKKWHGTLLGRRYSIRPISYKDFEQGYLKSTLPFLMKDAMLAEVKMRMKNKKTPVTFHAAERVSDGEIVAGLSVMESPSLGISYYLAGFFKKDAENDPVMIGLFDFWFQDALARGLKFIDLGNFWKPGDESSWKGFSLFKAKFNPLYFFYPTKLYKFSLNGRVPGQKS